MWRFTLHLISLLALLAASLLGLITDDAGASIRWLLVASMVLLAVGAFMQWKGRTRR